MEKILTIEDLRLCMDNRLLITYHRDLYEGQPVPLVRQQLLVAEIQLAPGGPYKVSLMTPEGKKKDYIYLTETGYDPWSKIPVFTPVVYSEEKIIEGEEIEQKDW